MTTHWIASERTIRLNKAPYLTVAIVENYPESPLISTEENVRLIAAAPEMLSMLEFILSYNKNLTKDVYKLAQPLVKMIEEVLEQASPASP